MAATVEQTNNKIIYRIAAVKRVAAGLLSLDAILRENGPTTGKNAPLAAVYRATRTPQSIIDAAARVESEYCLKVTPVLNDYYGGRAGAPASYNRLVSSENFVSAIDDIVYALDRILDSMCPLVGAVRAFAKHKDIAADARKQVAALTAQTVEIPIERRDAEICNKCETRMEIFAEESKLVCPNPFCNEVEHLVGVVFRDDQCYTQDGQKAKHNGYDTSRHYRFWIDRLQAKEPKTFGQDELDKIQYLIDRDGYNRRLLTCRNMRDILKDPKVNLTYLNDHIPLLIKTFGGMAPPQLTFQDDQMLSTRFDNAMRLYERVHADGGNKPYYPYFIYKLVEYAFKDDPEKLRLLDYIHLQSRDTVIKNDNTYKQMAAMSCPDDGIVYVPTNANMRV